MLAIDVAELTRAIDPTLPQAPPVETPPLVSLADEIPPPYVPPPAEPVRAHRLLIPVLAITLALIAVGVMVTLAIKLSSATTKASHLHKSLTATQGVLTSTQKDLAETKSNLDSSRADLAGTRRSLDGVTNAYAKAHQNVLDLYSCVTGLVNSEQLLTDNNYAGALAILTGVHDTCLSAIHEADLSPSVSTLPT